MPICIALVLYAACRTPPPLGRRAVVAAIPALAATPLLAGMRPAVAATPMVRSVPMELLAIASADALPDSLWPKWEPLQSVDIGVRTFAAVQKQYPVNFVAYLTRCLVNWEPTTRRWWVQRQAEAAAFATAEGVSSSTPFGSMELAREEQYRAAAYRSLIASVLLGLEQFQGPRGCELLLSKLRSRYAVSSSQPDRLRALAQLYSMLDQEMQPVDAVGALLGEADNGRVASIELEGRVTGLGPAPVAVSVERPPAKNGRVASARAVIRKTGRWRAVRVIDAGAGYGDGEQVEISLPPPPAGQEQQVEPPRLVATVRGGSIGEVRLLSPGRGYGMAAGSGADSAGAAAPDFASASESRLELRVAAPARASLAAGGCRTARVELLPEYALVGLELTDPGFGYNVNEPPSVSLRRVMAGSSPDEEVDGGWAAAAALESASVVARVEARSPSVMPAPELGQLQARLLARSGSASGVGALSLDRGMTLELLPPALAPIRPTLRGAFSLPIELPCDAFGSPAAAPVERQSPLTPGDVARIFLSGGLCGSTAHTLLVPLDVVKTRLQADPGRYNGPVDCARTLAADEGAAAFTQGLGATTVGYALAGALSFGLVELFGRVVRGAAGPGNALLFSVPLLGVASVLATAIVACALCPFEAVRVLAVRTGASSAEALQSVLAKGGPAALFVALPANVLKEVPFVVAKFITFDRASAALLAAFPEVADASLSGTLSLVAGAIAGVAAALASHPADVVFTKSNKEGGTLAGAISEVRDSPALLVQGLAPRLLFCAILVALQFYLYAQLRGILGVSKADLTLVWDALTVLN